MTNDLFNSPANLPDVETPRVVTELNESDLQLVVSKKTLGSLTTNARQILEIVKSGLARYDIANYDESNIDLAKKDKALLNNAAKALNNERVKIEKEFMLPFAEFKEVVAETVKLISECSGKIDIVVKQSEEKAKEQKKADILRYWESKNTVIVSFEKIFDSRWLNKTTKLKDVYVEIDNKVSKINDDITTLEAIGEDVELLKSLYLDTLNINSTIQYANVLKQNRERAKAAEEARLKAEKEAQSNRVEDGNKFAHQGPTRFPSPGNPFPSPQTEQSTHITSNSEVLMLTRAFKVTTTRENIIALGDFMNERDIDFEKIEL